MIKPLHNADHVVSPDGTVQLRGLTPGQRVHIVVVEEDESQWGPGALPGTRIYRPDQPRRALGFMRSVSRGLKEDDQPACDPMDWEANR